MLTTPDADRTMLTNLGISTSLTKNDIHEERLKDSQIAFEGIFMGRAKYEKASVHTMEIQRKMGAK